MEHTKKNILFSVIMPAYQCERWIQEAISSVQQQTEQAWELIIIEDCSTDHTWDIVQRAAVEDKRIKIYRNSQNQGVAKSRNRGMRLARGKYIAFLDGDDRWLPNKLAAQYRLLSEEKCEICYTSYEYIDENGNRIGKRYCVPQQFSKEEFLKENFIGCSTAAFSKEFAVAIFLREEYQHEDYVFWLELMEKGALFCGITDVLAEYRILSSSRSANKSKAALGRWRIYRDFMHFGVYESFCYEIQYIVRGLKKHAF